MQETNRRCTGTACQADQITLIRYAVRSNQAGRDARHRTENETVIGACTRLVGHDQVPQVKILLSLHRFTCLPLLADGSQVQVYVNYTKQSMPCFQ